MSDLNGPALATRSVNPDSPLGQIIKNRYRVMRQLSVGPIGTLYLAEDLSTGNRVAIRMLRRELAEDLQFARTFSRQAPLLADLCQKNDAIVKVHEFDRTDEGLFFIVMEYVDGKSLSDLIQQEGRLPLKRALRLAVQIAEGLEAAHNMGLVHGGLSPHNVIVVGEDVAKLMDFEIAGLRQTEAVKRIGCDGADGVEYMTPEQIEGGLVAEKTDVYAFGIVLYQILCGVAPFSASAPDVVLAKHLYKAPAPPRKLRKVPSSVERVVMLALEKRAKHRPSITAVAHDLWVEEHRLEHGPTSRCRAGIQALAGAVKDIATARSRPTAQWKLVGACSLLVLIALATTWMVLLHRRSESTHAPTLQQRSGRDAAEGPPPLPSRPLESKVEGRGNVSAPEIEPTKEVRLPSPPASAERAPAKPSPQQRAPAKRVPPPASGEDSAKSSQRARTTGPERGDAGDGADPSDPAGVIDWLLKEYSAKSR